MADGLLAAHDLAADTQTLLWECDVTRAFVKITLTPRAGEPIVRLAHTSGETTPSDQHWFEYGVPLVAGGVPLIVSRIMAEGDRIYAHSSLANVSATVEGKGEED
jgi:hypothetical protein